MGKKVTTEQFIERSRANHGNRYCYSKVIYVNTREKVTVTCLVHGDFQVTPSNHIFGGGCAKCVIQSRTFTTKQFIVNAKKVHGELYNYSKVVYATAHEKVVVICREHGPFNIVPHAHVDGKQGCPTCGQIKGHKFRFLTQSEFLQKCSELWKDRFDYSQVEYRGAHKHIIVVCKLHGEFKIAPNSHLQGKSCRKCSNEAQRKDWDEILTRCMEVHGQKYDYTEAKGVYKSMDTPVPIKCLSCQRVFHQRLASHTYQKSGCPHCGSYRSEHLCREMLEEITGKSFHKVKPKGWGKLELDGYNEELRLAFEYQGEQHVRFIPFFHRSEAAWIKQQERDKKKRELCKQNGTRLIEVPHTYSYQNEGELLEYLIEQVMDVLF